MNMAPGPENVRQDDYKDSLDIPYHLKLKHDEHEQTPKTDGLGKMISDYSCSTWGVEGYCENDSCSNDDHYVKAIICDKEWCPDCGEIDSFAHKRRMARLLDNRARQMNGIGYFVIEKRLNKRGEWRTKDSLSKAGIKARKSMKDLGFKRGISRVHWFGDPDENGKVRGWNPHFNLLVDGQYISKGRLKKMKRRIRRVMKDDNLIIHYSYAKTPAQMYHVVRYVTRATFRDQSWDYDMVQVVHGFRTTQHWGSVEDWQKPIQWRLDDTGENVKDMESFSKIDAGKCPCCEHDLTWNKEVIPMALVHFYPGAEDLGAGYYRLPIGKKTEPDPITDDDRYYYQLKREMQQHGLIPHMGKSYPAGHIKGKPGQKEYEYLTAQGEDIYPIFDENGELYMSSYEVAESRFALCSE